MCDCIATGDRQLVRCKHCENPCLVEAVRQLEQALDDVGDDAHAPPVVAVRPRLHRQVLVVARVADGVHPVAGRWVLHAWLKAHQRPPSACNPKAQHRVDRTMHGLHGGVCVCVYLGHLCADLPPTRPSCSNRQTGTTPLVALGTAPDSSSRCAAYTPPAG
jgi:hypothetical protein